MGDLARIREDPDPRAAGTAVEDGEGGVPELGRRRGLGPIVVEATAEARNGDMVAIAHGGVAPVEACSGC